MKWFLAFHFFLYFFHLLYRLSDCSIGFLLKFIRHLIHFLGVITHLGLLFQIANALPKSMHTIKNTFKDNSYIEYVVCLKCCRLYLISDCLISNHGNMESRKCDYFEFPDHPLLSRHLPCGEPLLKKIKIGTKFKLVPRKTYMYWSIIDSLKFMTRKKFFWENVTCGELVQSSFQPT